MDVLYVIEFCSDRWIKQRKENLYYKTHDYARRLRVRIVSGLCFVIAAIAGIFCSAYWNITSLEEDFSPYVLGMALCVGLCVASIFMFANSMKIICVRMPGTKLDYDGYYETDMYRVEFLSEAFRITKNGESASYSYAHVKHVCKDAKGILLADMDLYIPLEVVEKSKRRWLCQCFDIR